MPATLQNDAPFSTDFSGVAALQCMGSTAYTPATNPYGVAGSLEIVDGWMKATIRDTDPPTATGIRSEVTMPTQALNDEAWFTWEMMVRADEWPDNSGDISVAQCHPKDGILASGYFNFFLRNGFLTFAIPETEPPTEGSYNKTHFLIHPIKFDHNYKLAIHTKWVASAGGGFIEAFVDGVQVYKNWGRGTGYATDTPYFKIGMYDAPHAADFGTKSVRFRNLKRYSGNDGYSVLIGQPPLPQRRFIGI